MHSFTTYIMQLVRLYEPIEEEEDAKKKKLSYDLSIAGQIR